MAKNLNKVINKLQRAQDRIGTKIENLKARHARNLINEARALMGKSPLGRKTRKAKNGRKTRVSAKTSNGPTFGGKKVNGK